MRNKDGKTLYERLIEEGVEIKNHSSDLYFPVCDKSTAILKEFPDATGCMLSVFWNQITNTMWYDVPFGYIPYWRSKVSI